MTANPHLEDKFQLVGVAIALIFYGMNICLLIQLSRAYKVARLWANIVTFVTFILASASLSLISYVTIVGSIDHCNAPEGPVAWFSGHKFTSIWFATNSTTLMAVWILDSCVLYQCFTIYSVRKTELWVIGFPALLFLSSFGSGAYLLVMSTQSHLRVLPHFPLCLLTKLVMMSLIVIKLFRQRKTLRKDVCLDNKKDLARPYTSLIYILVQSYALHCSISALFFGLYISKNSAWRMVLPVAVQTGLTSHLLVRFQVMQNRYDRSSQSKEVITSIHFSGVDSHVTNTSRTSDA